MKRVIFFLAVLQGLHLNAYTQQQPDTILSRYRDYLFHTVPPGDVMQWAGSLKADGQWPDIDYASQQRANWEVSQHLRRVRDMVLAWANPASEYYHNTVLWKAVNAGLDLWLEKRYKNINWWHNEIGVPQYMRDIIIGAGNQLTAAQRAGALAVMDQLKVGGTGANLIWSADLGFHYGALTHDSAMMGKCRELIIREIKITRGDGIQPDYSFHQHGGRLQIYQYGAAFLKENTRLAWELRGTAWAFPKEKVDILADFVLKGWQWMARGIHTVPGTNDRAVSRLDALHSADIRGLLPYLSALCPEDAAAFKALYERQNGAGKPLAGFRYYPYSDFTAYQRPGFSFFLKTISDRTLPAESINKENLKGGLLNSGDAYLISGGNEYFNLMPVWDWNKLPGITGFEGAAKAGRLPFSGSVSDGGIGCTAMDYLMEGKDPQQNISAHKFWACHGDEVVCLIAGLRSAHIEGEIYTVLDQCRWRGPVTINKPGQTLKAGNYKLSKVKWIHHAGFAYIPLTPAAIDLKIGEASGEWSSVNASETDKPVTEKIFLPLLLLPVQPKEISTGYVLAACKTPRQAMRLSGKPGWKVLRNDKDCQAIRFGDGAWMAAFFSADSLKMPDHSLIRVDKPCLLLMAGHTLYFSDPAHKGGTLIIKIKGKEMQLLLPADGSTAEALMTE